MQQLFSEGKSFTVFPVKVIYLEVKTPLDFPIKAGVGASGRNFKKAVQRNRIKRLLRESYRTEKLPLLEFLTQKNKQVVVFFLLIDKVLPVHHTINNKMNIAIERLIKELNEKSASNN